MEGKWFMLLSVLRADRSHYTLGESATPGHKNPNPQAMKCSSGSPLVGVPESVTREQTPLWIRVLGISTFKNEAGSSQFKVSALMFTWKETESSELLSVSS